MHLHYRYGSSPLSIASLLAPSMIPTALASHVMQSPPSVCPFVCIPVFFIFWTEWPLTLTFCMWVQWPILLKTVRGSCPGRVFKQFIIRERTKEVSIIISIITPMVIILCIRVSRSICRNEQVTMKDELTLTSLIAISVRLKLQRLQCTAQCKPRWRSK